MSAPQRIAVLGAGAWGSALANVLARNGREVLLWARNQEVAAFIRARRESPRLPGIRLDDRVLPTPSIADAAICDAVLLAVPAQALREVACKLTPLLPEAVPTIACAKGIERGTRLFMTEVIAQCLPQAIPAILSGPSFALDVSSGLPTAVTLAARNEEVAARLAAALRTPTFRPYRSTDIRGVEIGGAAKNVLAIAAGIVHGRGLGASAAAALTTRGFAELARFGRVYGAHAETLTGLSGLGDLILTCSSRQSRNFSLGVSLGEGLSLEAIQRDGKLAEGVFTAAVLVDLGRTHGVEMPIAAAVAAVLEGRLSIDAATESLLMRPLRAEA